ncbi:telomerase Cajal body protein 1 homolog [Drosophila willistoni]|nr:telomerase Cajal body protein 1 homolog [Drosophila willistoni]
MEESTATNHSISMDEDPSASSLLNQNLSINSSMDMSISMFQAPAKETTGSEQESLALSSLSFSLTDAERLKLKNYPNSALNRPSSRSVLKEMSLNELEKSSSSRQENDTTMEDESTMEESSQVISIDDTIDVAPNNTTEKEYENNATLEPEIDPDEQMLPLVLEYFRNDIIELGRRCWTSSAYEQHYTKGCFWSPDGTCLLVPIHRDGMHVMELPTDLYGAASVTSKRNLSKMHSAVHIPEGGTVYDCVWYPQMNSQQPETCCWLATRQHEPINMWDAFDGSLRCSYMGYDEVDEVVAAISLAFSQDAEKIYAGYKRSIKIFDTNRPGRTYDNYPVKFSISSIAQTTEHRNTLTCGNWHGYIQHFDLRCGPKQGPLFTLGGHKAGVTQLKYAPGSSGDWYLFSGARKCPKLLHWDMRNYNKPLREFKRQVDTNQRIQFDLNEQHSWLASGDTRGVLNLWHLSDEKSEKRSMSLPLHDDCLNGIGFHPHLPILATSSGQYHFLDTESRDNETLLNATANGNELKEEHNPTPQVVDYENAVLLLWCGPSQE